MAANAKVALYTTTLTGTASSIPISSISQAYTHLELVVNYIDAGGGNHRLVINGDSSSSYSNTVLNTNGSAVASNRYTSNSWIYTDYFGGGSTNGATLFAKFIRYSDTSINKNVLIRQNSSGEVNAIIGSWRNSTGINAITISAPGSNFAAGTTVSLYGILAEGTGAQATGGVIYADSTYYYHAFLASGTFTPNNPAAPMSVDVLVVAGGGGGGVGFGAGAGGGGVLAFTSQSVSTGTTVTVGAGGAAGPSSNTHGSNGSDSQFGSLTLVKGGGGGGWGDYSTGAGYSGGSGGGGGGGSGGGGTFWTPGNPTAGQGYIGGTGNTSASGSGGGAGGAGGNATTNVGGGGGAGASYAISGGATTGLGVNVSGTYYFAGGGSGVGTSASGTPGIGAVAANTAGLPNTGQGGGGDSTTAKGGSGVVIVRYLKA